MALIDWFDRVYVVSLASRTDRRRQMAAMLARAGVEICAGGVEFFDAVRSDAADGFPSPGARGCFLSHLAVLRRAKEEGVQRLLVLEDDADLRYTWDHLEQDAARRLAQIPWEMAYLGQVLSPARDKCGPRDTVEWVKPPVQVTGSHAYLIRPRARDMLIAYLEAVLLREPGDPAGGPMHYDGAMNMFRAAHPGERAVLPVPSLIQQRPSSSDITPRRRLDRFGVTRHATNTLRNIRCTLARL